VCGAGLAARRAWRGRPAVAMAGSLGATCTGVARRESAAARIGAVRGAAAAQPRVAHGFSRGGWRGAQARLHALALCEALLPRSRAFRGRLAEHFPLFLERAVGFRAARPLPAPADVAAQLRERALAATERWAEDHGAHYQQARQPRR